MSFDWSPGGCCCGGEWFDFYAQLSTRSGTTDIVERVGACSPVGVTQNAYASSDYDPPYEAANSLGNYEFIRSLSVYKADNDGDYFWLVVEDSSNDFYLQLWHAPATGNPTEIYTSTALGSTLGIVEAVMTGGNYYTVPTAYTGVASPILRRDAQGGLPFGHFGTNVLNKNSYFAGAGNGTAFWTANGTVAGAGTGSDYKSIAVDGTITAVNGPRTNLSAFQANENAKVILSAREQSPWACGTKITVSGLVYTTRVYTGERTSSTPWELAETNLIDTYVETAGSPATYADYHWTVNFYDRNRNGDEIVQAVRFDFGATPATFDEERWYINGTNVITNTSFDSNRGEILIAKAIDPDPDLSTDAKFLVVRLADSDPGDHTLYTVAGWDDAGTEVWTGDTASYENLLLYDASDRYAYFTGLSMDESDETDGVISDIGADGWMVRLDGGLNWPFVLSRSGERFPFNQTTNSNVGSIKNSSVPLSADIDLKTQFLSSY